MIYSTYFSWCPSVPRELNAPRAAGRALRAPYSRSPPSTYLLHRSLCQLRAAAGTTFRCSAGKPKTPSNSQKIAVATHYLVAPQRLGRSAMWVVAQRIGDIELISRSAAFCHRLPFLCEDYSDLYVIALTGIYHYFVECYVFIFFHFRFFDVLFFF